MVHAPHIGFKGGLLLAWKPGVDLECFQTNANIISAWCYSDLHNHPWMLSCIYGSLYAFNKSQFWNNMMKLGENFNGPWLCIDDFNMILSQQDKMRGLPYASSFTNYFHDFVNSNGMVDFKFTRNHFTWSNHWDGHNVIRQRLDCGMASSQWVYLLPSFSIFHLPASGSDHNPLLLDTVQFGASLLQPFKFEEF